MHEKKIKLKEEFITPSEGKTTIKIIIKIYMNKKENEMMNKE